MKIPLKFHNSLIFFQANKDRLKKPNVIVLLADDFGIGDFQVFKKFPIFWKIFEFKVNSAEAKVPTPNIDRLAKEGINFRDGHSASRNGQKL